MTRCAYCGEPALTGYRVCEGCKEAREIYPSHFEGDPPDKLEATPVCEFEAMYNEQCTNAEIAGLRLRCDNLRATRDELAAENARLEAERDAAIQRAAKAEALIAALGKADDYYVSMANGFIFRFAEFEQATDAYDAYCAAKPLKAEGEAK